MLNKVDLMKKTAGEQAAAFIQDGMTVGLGSGSTVYWGIRKLGELVEQGLNIKGVPTSRKTEGWAKKFDIPLVAFSEMNKLDIAIDGADEIDEHFNLIKGGGGALYREKVIGAAADQLIIVVDESKVVTQLGSFPLPIEVVPFGWENTARNIAGLGCTPELRKKDKSIFISDNKNYILDCQFPSISAPDQLHTQLKQMIGVVETGLFIDMTNKVIIGRTDGIRIVDRESSPMLKI
ncbi:ribose-5-phosphate isomerase RpiA [Gracilibacillus alcaliphilus]|uniref:ribose-5-phosphate isomerase RpiA n=1 Tax=Gracilibacillus alcaliphilus TaxID=1401441 RepID=UPI00195AF399|nr:ribose-5-phosphate isomerase RpiA [Gracilibacillus alcaliphilus]MBM7676810.1 ribose 5-phosphate isomerase A [Gracilibacillus alcaliphilus]